MEREHVENLKPGHFVVVIGFSDDSTEVAYNPAWGEYEPVRRRKLDGRPFRIIHIEPPFLIVADGKNRRTIDIRDVFVRKVSRRYVEVLHDRTTSSGREAKKISNDLIISGKKLNSKPDPDGCPNCGRRMSLVRKQGRIGWYKHCSDCDMDFGLAIEE